MAIEDLKNKPLVEAIFEFRWSSASAPQFIQANIPGLRLTMQNSQNVNQGGIDPNYNILFGRFYDKVSGEMGEYPYHEPLPTAAMPLEMSTHVVQHRFRVAQDQWPLLQIGPGIMTVNDTSGYKWDDFRSRILSSLDKLKASYIKPSDVEVNNLVLKYINAIEFDYVSQDINEFLNTKMGVNVTLPADFFSNGKCDKDPRNFLFQSSFRSSDPEGHISIQLGTGSTNGKPSLIWETSVVSSENPPNINESFETWLDKAHKLNEEWFFTLISGDLERRFQGE
ncbi:TIGR04255 family protein [Neobacillus sp. OS1-33]|uniref:TIGR04255 family protein n=1 Tax=Neobacillus sp. OS1-33 TaxID=3070683 RepID=UPI0027E0AB90|nr:TIGR04255 family protein [Neobacillus sp. OS1-33]WML24112.1 TIGR04255 family protein [Neobacillus sp. OS1-33]